MAATGRASKPKQQPVGITESAGPQGEWSLTIVKQFLAVVLSSALVLATSACDLVANDEVQATVQPAVQPGQVTAEQLRQLVAPIALYPDELVAEILAASTYPTEIFEADSWLRQNSGLKGTQLASEVDKQSWDPNVKALTQFPSVLANMNKNLSWDLGFGGCLFQRPAGCAQRYSGDA